MAIDYVRNIISSGYNLAKINDNFAKIEDALVDAVSRSGTGPNQMEADLDLNSNDILNVNKIDAVQLILNGVEVGTSEVPLTILDEILAAKDDAEDARDLSQAWAEGTLPGGVGTKSAKEWAAEASAVASKIPTPVAEDVGKVPVAKSDGTFQLLFLNSSVPSRAAMKSLPAIAAGATVDLVEPLRNGKFILKAGTPPRADPQEGIFVLSNTPNFYWERLVNDKAYDASWWGVIGDDSSDNQVALQAACDAVSSGTILILPTGTIRVGGTITITGGYRSVIGFGSGTTIRRTFAEGHLFILQNTAPATINSVTIGNFRVDSTVTVTSGGVVTVQKGLYCNISNIEVSGGLHGFWLLGGFEIRLTNCSVTYVGGVAPAGRVGFFIERSGAAYGSEYGGNFYLTNCSSNGGGNTASAGAANGLKVVAADGVFVDNCYFGYFASASAALDNSTTGFLTGICFTNTWFDHFVSVGVLLSGTTGTNFTNVKFVACTFWGGGSSLKNLWIAGSARGVIVSDCRMGGGVSEQNVIIEGSALIVKLSGCHLQGSTGDGIRNAGCSRVSVTNCDVEGGSGGQNGIRCDGGNVFKAIGCDVTGFVNGISTSGALNNYVVSNNTLIGNTSKVVDGATGTTKSVSGNV